jgi:hypothetical protein
MRVNLGSVLPEHEGESAWQTLLHNPSKGEYIRRRWGVQMAYDCFDKMRVKKELVVCVLAGFVSFCFAAAGAASAASAAFGSLVLVYFKAGCIVIAIGAVESEISRFVSAREHARPLLRGEPPVPADTIRCGGVC